MAGEYLKSSVHVHSKLCDGKNTLDEIAVTAWRNGLQTLGFSGHSHTPCDLEYCMTQSRTALYKAQVAKLKERYAGKLDILCGLEWDLFSDDDPTQYDYWIGSTHYVKGPKTGKYYEIDWREEDLRACIDDDFDGDALAVVEAYFANVAKVAEKKPTILGHFDLIKKINGNGKFFDENDPRYTAAANAALMTAARNRCVLEVNTSAVYRGFRKDFFPSDAILKEWLVLSGNVVITADAHDTKALTFGFEAVAAKLKELGYAKVGTFLGNSFCRFFPQQVPIYASQFVSVFLASVTNAFALVVNGTAGTVPQVFCGLVTILAVHPKVHPVLGGQFKVIQLCFQRRFGWECFPGAVRCSPDAVVREDHFFHRSGVGPCGRIGESDRVLTAPIGVSCDLQIQILIGNWFAQWIAYGIQGNQRYCGRFNGLVRDVLQLELAQNSSCLGIF